MRINIVLLLMLLLGCIKQSAPDLGGGESASARNAVCARVDFINTLLEKNNLINLFQCLEWDKKFPNLYSGINKSSESAWNKVVMPFNDSFFRNRDRRDRIFGHVKALDQKGALEDLSDVVKILNQTNILDGLGLIFKCAGANPPDECRQRGNALSVKELEYFLELSNYDPGTIEALYSLLYEIVSAIRPNYDEFKRAMNLVLPHESFHKSRVKLVDILMQEYLNNGVESRHIEAMSTILNDSARPFLYRWLANDSVTPNILRDLYRKPFDNGSILRKYIRASREFYQLKMRCQNNGGQDMFEVDVAMALNGYIDQMVSMNYDRFMGAALESSSIVLMTRNGCEELSRLRYPITYYDIINEKVHLVQETINLNLEDANSKIINYLHKPPTFDLLRAAVSGMVTSAGHPRVTEVFSSDVTDMGLLFLKNADDFSPQLSEQVLGALKRIGPTFYNDLFNTLLKSTKHKNVMTAAAKAWLFLSEDEKNHLFRFVDHHYRIDVDAISLFEFYTKLLYEFKDTSIYFQKEWLATDLEKTKTVLSYGEVFFNLSGKNVLSDMEIFFSREHVLKIITILSRGVDVPIPTLAALTGRIVPVSPNLQPNSVVYRPLTPSTNTSAMAESGLLTVECLNSLAKTGLTIFNLFESMPETCKQVSTESVLLDIIGGMGEFNKDLAMAHPPLATAQHSFLDIDGFFRRDLQNINIASMVILGTAFNSNSHTDGLEQFLHSLKDILFERERHTDSNLPSACQNDCKGYISLFDQALKYINKISKVEESIQQKIRILYIEKFAKLAQENRFSKLLSSLATILREYSNFYLTDPGPEILPKQRTSECRNVLRSDIGANACPTKEEIVNGSLKLVDLFLRSNEEDRPTALELVVDALHPNHGLKIPYDMKNQRKYVLTMEETFKMIYSMMDINHRHQGQLVNQSLVLYQQPGEKDPLPRTMTTAQRIEVVIRDIRFDNNYLGAHYMNSVARAEDYDFTVNANYSLLKTCALGISFCGKFFAKDEKRMVRNAIETYPSLLEANTIFGHANYMETLLQLFVGSSSKISAKSAIVRFGKVEVPFLQTKKQLEKHNGKILTELSLLSTLSNAGRVIHDRLGRRGKAQFISFVESEDFRRLDTHLLRYISNTHSKQELEKILIAIKTEPEIIEDIVGFMYSLDYNDQQIVENTIYNLLRVMTYVGPSEIINKPTEYTQFSGSSGISVLKVLSYTFKNWKRIKVGLPSDFSALGLLRPINNLSRFILHMFNANPVNKEAVYTLLNEGILFIEEVFFKINRFENGQSGSFAVVLEKILMNRELTKEFIGLTKAGYELIEVLHKNERNNAFNIASDYLNKTSNAKFKFDPLFEYLELSTARYTCQDDVVLTCSDNPHFDEPMKVLALLSKEKNQGESSRLRNALEKVFYRRMDDIITLLRSVFPSLRLVQ